MTMLTLTGTHGTSVANAQKIKASGFKASTGSGAIRGTAAYFWAYVDHVELGRQLAIAWCKKGNKTGGCASIFCSIACDDENFADLEDLAIKEGFYKFVERHNKSRLELDDAQMCELYNAYYALLEYGSEKSLNVARIKIWLDSGIYSRRVSGNTYDCYVVRALDSISVQRVLDESGNEL